MVYSFYLPSYLGNAIWIGLTEARNMCKIFSLVPSKKTCHQRKVRLTNVWCIKYLQINFWMIKLTKTPILSNCQVPNGFFGIKVNFIIQKLKSKRSLSQISLVTGFFWGNKRKYFTHIPGLRKFKASSLFSTDFDLQKTVLD